MWNKFCALARLTETRVVLALLAAIMLVDGSLRLAETRLSGNLAHVEEIPELLAAAGEPARRSLLVLGNSLINNGVSAEVIEASLPALAIAKITPDATGLWDWQCLLDHQVVAQQAVQFDTVVIGFAWHLLSDQTRSDPSRLGALYCRFGDLGRAGAIGLSSSGDIGEFIAARVFRTYALRDTLRNRFFQMTVPHYIDITQNSNQRAGAPKEAAAPKQTVHLQYTYQVLSELALRLKREGTRVIVVAMPVVHDYEIDPTLEELADRGALEVIDLREVPGIERQHYLDDMHLNPEGQKILSQALADVLQQELASAT